MDWKLVCAACVLVAAGRADAWGPDGHRIIAEIAEQRLSDEAKAAIADLLDGQAMADVSTWADQVRSREEYRWTGPLHYANLAAGATRFDMDRDCGEAGCVVSAIKRYRAVLEDDAAAREEKVEALKFLIHFVGDIHQPLHVSFARDRGGNDVKVTFLGHATNLHRVWDAGLIDTRDVPWPVYMETLSERITVDQRAAWATTDPSVWATESYQLAVSNAYAIPHGGELGEEYVSRNIGIVETRLSQGGVRLAIVLNEVFAPELVPAAEPNDERALESAGQESSPANADPAPDEVAPVPVPASSP